MFQNTTPVKRRVAMTLKMFLSPAQPSPAQPKVGAKHSWRRKRTIASDALARTLSGGTPATAQRVKLNFQSNPIPHNKSFNDRKNKRMRAIF